MSATPASPDCGAGRLPHPRPPWAEIRDLLVRWLGTARRAGLGRLPAGTPGGEEAILRATGFDGPDRVEVAADRVLTRTEDQVVAAMFSLSYAAPHLFGVRVGDFETELRAILRATSRDGAFSERQREVALDVYRPTGRGS